MEEVEVLARDTEQGSLSCFPFNDLIEDMKVYIIRNHCNKATQYMMALTNKANYELFKEDSMMGGGFCDSLCRCSEVLHPPSNMPFVLCVHNIFG